LNDLPHCQFPLCRWIDEKKKMNLLPSKQSSKQL
jgi:hypothetical protein